MKAETKRPFYKNDVFYLLGKYADAVPGIEAEVLLSFIFKCDRADLYTGNYGADEDTERIYDSFVKRRLSGEPLQYITGTAVFMERGFTVNSGVFIPRPETEHLVNEVSSFLESRGQSHRNGLRVLDMCTGCGNIAVTLAHLLPQSEIIATDISEASLEVARKNSALHGVRERIAFYNGDLFQALPSLSSLSFDKRPKFDIIVCNPPYIKSFDVGFLQDEVRMEPALALDGGVDGLDFYRRIAGESPDYLEEGGSLFLEIGFSQADEVKTIFSSQGLLRIHKVIRDFAGIDRVLWISSL